MVEEMTKLTKQKKTTKWENDEESLFQGYHNAENLGL